MKYKVVYQFRWILILIFLLFIYLSNLIFIKLPFIGLDMTNIFSNYLPNFRVEMQIYSIQTIVVWTCGVVSGPRIALITLLLYLILGLIGFPIFASGGGFNYYQEPTFGYLMSLPILAFLSGLFYKRNKKFLSIFLPILTTHLLGIIYLLLFKRDWFDISWHLSFSTISYDLIFSLLLMPFIPLLSFFFKEMFIQEVPVRRSLYG